MQTACMCIGSLNKYSTRLLVSFIQAFCRCLDETWQTSEIVSGLCSMCVLSVKHACRGRDAFESVFMQDRPNVYLASVAAVGSHHLPVICPWNLGRRNSSL